ncbi:hypothetical protein IscW_ISCW001090 [Ixodes scapularis]|uniref:Uncharacterized protein n=1 Tax=Ixodes scapularis TaxID=6945 RepID=B7P6X3_IXOSC|nr:hypothetical protein IscW_ISCW001090 [Ixodes scapularis]|eukprot:XP_002409350.1 hypothetical protein IscW_ISCW001090 [Ixodes scapularis]
MNVIRYKVPSGFSSVKENPLSLENVGAEEKRIWLFQTPNEVNIADLNGLEISLRNSDEKVVRIGNNSYTFSRTAETEYTKTLSVAMLSNEDGQNILGELAVGVHFTSRNVRHLVQSKDEQAGSLQFVGEQKLLIFFFVKIII